MPRQSGGSGTRSGCQFGAHVGAAGSVREQFAGRLAFASSLQFESESVPARKARVSHGPKPVVEEREVFLELVMCWVVICS